MISRADDVHKTCLFHNIYISQGSVTTSLKCSEMIGENMRKNKVDFWNTMYT